jgi:hypothetical protein
MTGKLSSAAARTETAGAWQSDTTPSTATATAAKLSARFGVSRRKSTPSAMAGRPP